MMKNDEKREQDSFVKKIFQGSFTPETILSIYGDMSK